MTEPAILPLDRREWWPVVYLDETMPDGRATPSGWLIRLDDGAHRCGDTDPDGPPTFAVAEGEVIEFVACDDLGRTILTFDAAGAPHWSTRPPDDAYLFDADDYEMGGDGPDDYARNWLSFNTPRLGERMEIAAHRWGPGIRCRFTAENGPPRFVPLDPIPEVDPALPEIAREDSPDLFASPVA